VSEAVLLAVDGGNTKTLAVVCDATGRTLGAGRAGCGDIYGSSSPDAAIDAITSACHDALASAGAGAHDVDAAVFSLAGADWPEDYALLEGELPGRLGLRVPVQVVNDAHGALRGGTPDWVGVAVVYGTHCAIGARNHAGEVFPITWWPDGSGAVALGEWGLRAVQRADLGLSGPTALTELALHRYGVPDVRALVHAFTRRGGRVRGDAAFLAADVLSAAADDDEIALGIVGDQARSSGLQALAAARGVGLAQEGLPVVLSGGVLINPAAELLARATLDAMPGAVRVDSVLPPIAGAVLLALDRLGLPADGALVHDALPAQLFERSPAWVASPSAR
jgi:N-acetylglucosamine kinase-like BadF-type ATPase